jgi:hypothetical protein
MTGGLPQRVPGSSLSAHFERQRDELVAIAATSDEHDSEVPRSFRRDVETMKHVAERLRIWSSENPAE